MKKFIWVVTICLLNLVSIQVFADSLAIPLKQGMKYDKARKALINAGWQAESKSARISPDQSMAEATSCGNSSDFNDKMCREFEEWEGCGHVCDMYFIDATGKRLRVMTDHNDYFDKPKLTGFVKGWEIEK